MLIQLSFGQQAFFSERGYIDSEELSPALSVYSITTVNLAYTQNDTAYIIEDSVIIKTRDNASLTATITRIKDQPSLPVILVFTIYTGMDRFFGKWFADYGYNCVVVTTRGIRLSPQEIEPFEHDSNDAYDIIDWISKQPWCNGKVAMFGSSYFGFTQWAATKKIHPALKTIIPSVAAAPGIDLPGSNGVLQTYWLRWLHFTTNSKLNDYEDYNNQKRWDSVFLTWFKTGRSFRSLDTIAEKPSKIFQRWLLHPSYDNFYKSMIPGKEEFSKINIPVLSITGYFDGSQSGALYYFTQHYANHHNPQHYILIGPYDHTGIRSTAPDTVSGYAIDRVAVLSFPELTAQWLNYILRDGKKPEIIKDKINFQVMGTNTWRHVSSMRELSNDTLTFYLNKAASGKHLTLSNKPGRKNVYSKYMIDFKDRKTSNESDAMILDSNLNTKGYLSFISQPLDRSMSLNGRIFSDLHCITNKKDFDIEMEMYEMMPDGRYFLLSWYIGRASYAKNREKRQLLTPGRKETIPVYDTYFTSKQMNKGSRLIILLGIPKNQYLQINYGTGKDVSDETIADGKIPLEIKWLSDSWIKIPVIK